MRAVLIVFFSFIPGLALSAQSNYRIAILGCHKQFEPAPALVKYLEAEPLSPVKVEKRSPGLHYRYYEGNFTQLSEVKKDVPDKEGIASDLDPMNIAEREDHFAVIYEGLIEMPIDGVYTFSTYSDDGSRLYLHDQLVVDNDGSHSARLRKGRVALKKGLHPIRIEYFEDYEGQTLTVKFAGQDGKEEVLGKNRFFVKD